MDDQDKQILDEVAEAATYLYLKLMEQVRDEPGRMTDKVFSGAQAAEMTAAAVPGILHARLGVLRVAS
jgi:hypothetical protein